MRDRQTKRQRGMVPGTRDRQKDVEDVGLLAREPHIDRRLRACRSPSVPGGSSKQGLGEMRTRLTWKIPDPTKTTKKNKEEGASGQRGKGIKRGGQLGLEPKC